MRRELERRRLSQEEKRVASAAAEYRLRVAERGNGGRALGGREGTKAPVILNKVQSLLQENNKPSPKTASGYGRFTGSVSTLQGSFNREQKPLPTRPKPFSSDGREPLAVSIVRVKDSTALDVAAQPVRAQPLPQSRRVLGLAERRSGG
jgi:AP2-associated kinase